MKKLLYIFIILSIYWSSVTAQSTEAPAKEKYPALNGHRFLSTSAFKSSFVSTSFQADVGFGKTSVLDIPGIEVGDYEILSFQGILLYVDLSVQYQQRFTPWLAFFINGRMAGRVGADMSAMLADGVNTLSGGEIGWLVRMINARKFNLAGTVKVANINGSFINIPGYFEELINNEPYPSVVKKVPGLSVGMGLRGAYAFNPSFGLQFNMDLLYGESLERGTTTGYFSSGIIGDVDFNPKRDVPIGLALGYSLTTSPTVVMADGGVANLVLGKISYTGASDFELGLQLTLFRVYLQSIEDHALVKKAALSFKFYF